MTHDALDSFFELKELDWRLALHPRGTAEIIGPITALIEQLTECCSFGRPSMPVITTTTYTKVLGRAGAHGHVFPIHVALNPQRVFSGDSDYRFPPTTGADKSGDLYPCTSVTPTTPLPNGTDPIATSSA